MIQRDYILRMIEELRRVLAANTLISAVLLGAVALFTAETPHLIIVAVLLDVFRHRKARS